MGCRGFAKKIFPERQYFVVNHMVDFFALRKELIHNYERSFYLKLLNISEEYKNPIEGH